MTRVHRDAIRVDPKLFLKPFSNTITSSLSQTTTTSLSPIMSPPASAAITSTTLGTHLPLLATGKVREIYALTPSTLLFVATDRISAYDVILSTGIPSKGALLTRISAFWFAHLSSRLPHLRTHFLSLGLPADVAARVGKETVEHESLQERCCVVKKLKVLPVESIVRGYITGSAWESYKKTGKVNGEVLPEGLEESQKLPRPIWTPSTKAEQGAHDENISREEGESCRWSRKSTGATERDG